MHSSHDFYFSYVFQIIGPNGLPLYIFTNWSSTPFSTHLPPSLFPLPLIFLSLIVARPYKILNHTVPLVASLTSSSPFCFFFSFHSPPRAPFLPSSLAASPYLLTVPV